jgi:hypothetical protein
VLWFHSVNTPQTPPPLGSAAAGRFLKGSASPGLQSPQAGQAGGKTSLSRGKQAAGSGADGEAEASGATVLCAMLPAIPVTGEPKRPGCRAEPVPEETKERRNIRGEWPRQS